jgi:hypothetical protein
MSIDEMVNFQDETEPMARIVICIRLCDSIEYSTFVGPKRGYVQDFTGENVGSKVFKSFIQRSSGSGHLKLDPHKKLVSDWQGIGTNIGSIAW